MQPRDFALTLIIVLWYEFDEYVSVVVKYTVIIRALEEYRSMVWRWNENFDQIRLNKFTYIFSPQWVKYFCVFYWFFCLHYSPGNIGLFMRFCFASSNHVFCVFFMSREIQYSKSPEVLLLEFIRNCSHNGVIWNALSLGL